MNEQFHFSEDWQRAMAHHIADKVNWMAAHRKTPAERSELKKRMYNYPCKNHRPC